MPSSPEPRDTQHPAPPESPPAPADAVDHAPRFFVAFADRPLPGQFIDQVA